MKFQIGPWRYTLRITEGPIVKDGVETPGAVLEREREILLAATCEPHARLSLLIEMVIQAHAIHFGPATAASAQASILKAIMRDLTAAGGERTLMRLGPGDALETGAARMHVLTTRNCPECGQTVAPGSVIATATEDPGICAVAMWCEFHQHVARWHERIGPDGEPSGARAGEEVEHLRGAEAAEFLKRWPHACPDYLPA